MTVIDVQDPGADLSGLLDQVPAGAQLLTADAALQVHAPLTRLI